MRLSVYRRMLSFLWPALLLLTSLNTAEAAISVAQSLTATAVQLPYLPGGGPYTPLDLTSAAYQGRDLILHLEQTTDITVGETLILVLPAGFEFDLELNSMAFIDATDVGGAFSLTVTTDSLMLTCETNIGGSGNIRLLALFASCAAATNNNVPALPVPLTGTADIDPGQALAGYLTAVPGPEATFTAPQADSTATAGGDGGYAFTCSGTLSDVLEATYSLYWSIEPGLPELNEAAFAALDLSGQPLINLPAGDLLQELLTADLLENEQAPYYLYATSSLTAQRTVGESGWLRVYHFPGVTQIDPSEQLFLDSGGLYNPVTGAEDGSGSTQVVLGFTVDDLDSDPWVSLFYGPADVPATAIQTSGSPPALAVSGLTSCSSINPEPLNSSLYNEYPWTIYNSASSWVPTGQYSIYAVVADGRHVDLQESAAPVVVYHTPVIDLQTPPSTVINLAEDFCFTFNWGETVDGDRDADDDALIAFYIDASTDSLADFSQTDFLNLADSLSAHDGVLTNGELLIGGIHEDPDQQNDNMFVWYPAQLPPALASAIINSDDYLHFYAIIEDEVTARLGSFNDGNDNFLEPEEPVTAFTFEAAPNVMLVDPSLLGVSISANESYLVRWVYAWNFGDTDQQVMLLLGDGVYSGADSSWADLTGTLDNIWVVNSLDGTIPQHISTPAGSATTWDFRPQTMTGPSLGEGLTLEESGDATYHLFLVVSSNGAGETPADSDPVFFAPGTIDINGFGSGVHYNLQLRPYLFDTFPGDTVTIDIYPQTGISTADMVSLYVDIDTAAFAVIAPEVPFVLGPDFQPAGVLENDNHGGDLSEGRYHLDFTYFENGAPIPEFNDGTHLLCTLQLLPRRNPATSYTIDNLVLAVDDEANRFTSFYQDGDLLGTTIQSPAAISHSWARGRISGHVQLQGRDYNSLECTFILRQPGSWLPVSDPLFNLNDINSQIAGLQLLLDDDGTYQLHSLPDGNWELVAQVPGWLHGYYPFTIQHGELLEGVNPHFNGADIDLLQLIAGDCAGYVDSTGSVGPDNQIDATDLNALIEGYGTTPDSLLWNELCDFDGDDFVYIADLTLCTSNLNSSGVPPVYRASHSGATPRWQLESRNSGGLTTWTLTLLGGTDLIGWSARLALPPLELISVQLQPVLNNAAGEQAVVNYHRGNTLLLAASRRGNTPGVNGDLLLAEFTLQGDNQPLPVLLLAGHTVDSRFVTTGGELPSPPASFSLPVPWPNPFNSSISIPLVIYETIPLELAVYNILGQRVTLLYRDTIAPGSHLLQWRADNLAGGLYFVRALTVEHQEIRKVIYLP